jgi:serine/threonine protein kinase/tetratricopeptide (TPR) repeat protein
MLLERPGELVTREAIQARLWPNGTVVEFEHSVNSAIKRLRQALLDTATTPRFIETLTRKGYRFIGVLEPAADEPAGLTPGTIISHYRILAEAGRGAMGVVYKAEDTNLGRMVALKFLPDELATHPPALERLRREARMIAALNHPGICTMHELGEASGHVFLVMEFLEGETLRERGARKPLSDHELLDVAVQVAKALEAAHGQGMVHRDIKPDNLFLTKQGVVKLMDFGLAKLVEEESGGAQQSSVTGTSGYMSPEQIRGEMLDARSDIYSMGKVLEELGGESPPKRLVPILGKALTADPSKRWQSAGDLRGALEATDHGHTAILSTRSWIALAGVVALGLLAAIYVMSRGRPGNPAQPKIRSLAVLPLKNLTGDPTQEYLADGMTDALIARLSTIHDLRVISHTSVTQFKTPQLSVPEIAKMLHVDAVVEGSVMRQDNRIRVTAQLIRGATDEHFWSETYDRDLRDVFAVQSELARAIAEKVQVTVTGAEHARLTAARPVAPEVYESYLKGRFALQQSISRAAVEESIAYFEHAIKMDPTFAPAYVGLAAASRSLGTIFIGAPADEMRPKVISAARKALELDPDLAEAHVILAAVLQQQWHWADAETEYRRALELNPNDAEAHAGLAFWLVCRGRTDEAVAWAQRGRELNPLAVSGESIAWILFQSHRYEEAIREVRSELAVHPDGANALTTLGLTLVANGQPADAIPVLEKAVSVSHGSPGATGELIRAYAHAGRRKDALRLLAELQQRRRVGYVPAGAFVIAYLGLGDNDQSFAWLEQAYKEQSNILQMLKMHPYFDPIRGDPRFADLLRRTGLE